MSGSRRDQPKELMESLKEEDAILFAGVKQVGFSEAAAPDALAKGPDRRSS